MIRTQVSPRHWALLAMGTFLSLSGCGSETSSPSPPPTPSPLLGHINLGCSAEGDSVEFRTGDAYLNGYSFDGDTLRLEIHFEANCCPGFEERALVEEGRIFLTVVDTLYDCRCICPYDNAFLFLWEDSGEVRIDFRSVAEPHGGDAICGFDTTLILR